MNVCVFCSAYEVDEKYCQPADEMVIAKDLGARKAGMLSKSDVIVVLPGGIGTLDELTEILELKKQRHHDKPIIILNLHGFYNGFLAQLIKMHQEGFTPINIGDLAYFTNNVNDAKAFIDELPAGNK